MSIEKVTKRDMKKLSKPFSDLVIPGLRIGREMIQDENAISMLFVNKRMLFITVN